MATIIPEKLIFVSTKREKSMDGKLSFISYFDVNNCIFQENSMNKWKDKDSVMTEFDNTPQNGFVIGESAIHGLNYTPKFNVRIYSTTHDVEFEISMENLLSILKKTTVDKGYINGDFVFAWKDKTLLLVPTNDNEYHNIKKHSDIIYSKNNNKKESYSFGDAFIIKKHKKKTLINSEMIYLGLHDVPDFILRNNFKLNNFKPIDETGTQFKLEYKTKPKHIFYKLNTHIFTGHKDTSPYRVSGHFEFFDNINEDEIAYLGSPSDFNNKKVLFYIDDNNYDSLSIPLPKEMIDNGYVHFNYDSIEENFKFTSINYEFLSICGNNKELLCENRYSKNFDKKEANSIYNYYNFDNVPTLYMSTDFQLYEITKHGYADIEINQCALINKKVKIVNKNIGKLPTLLRARRMYTFKIAK